MTRYSFEIYQLIARYFTGEVSTEASAKLEAMLEKDSRLVKEFELCKSVLLDNCDDLSEGSASMNRFERITQRLKDEGLM